MKFFVGGTWRELLWPPRSWWLDKPWGSIWLNHPISHGLSGIGLAVLVLVLWPDAEVWRRLVVVGFIGAYREEQQMEYWSDRGGYPLYSAVWDALFVLLGAALVEFALTVFL